MTLNKGFNEQGFKEEGVIKMQRNLDLTIRVNRDDFEVDVYEPESGEVKQFQFSYQPGTHPEFNQALGEEVYSWINLWMWMEAENH